MKPLHKDPILYYLLVPALVALWPILLGAVYIPRAQRGWVAEQGLFTQSQDLVAQICILDPTRVESAEPNDAAGEFAYAKAVDRVANLCRIPSSNYRLTSGAVVPSKGHKSQTAKVILKDVDIVSCARFLSTMGVLWADLQCEKLKLTRKKGLPDLWDADMDFRYLY